MDTRWDVIGAALVLGWAGAVQMGCAGSGEEPAPAARGGDGAVSERTDAVVTDGSEPDDGDRPSTSFGDPLPGLSAEELAAFELGKEEFEAAETPEEGLGPVFNDVSCVACHSAGATGGGSDLLETRFGAAGEGGFDGMPYLGGSLRQDKGIGVFPDPDPTQPACNYVAEVTPSEATLVSQRRSTPLFGLGLVDAVPESTFRDLARRQARAFPGEAGRVAMVHDIASGREAVGRFGWKGQVPTLHQFAGDAYLNEMGITSPEFPDESCPQGDCSLLRCDPLPGIDDAGDGVVAFTDFMTFLAPPPRGPVTDGARRGQEVFSRIGCQRCHTPTLRTGGGGSPALRNVRFHPYSDFLLHDMGTLGDGIELGDAAGDEFRTAPLWGVRLLSSFLHDGRAGSLDEAIRAHDGQGGRARDEFVALSADERSALIEFLNSL